MSPVLHLRKCALLSIKHCHFNNSLLCLGGAALENDDQRRTQVLST